MAMVGSFSVVPTHVGVNRGVVWLNPDDNRRPHARGGEPLATYDTYLTDGVVPTHVGVNRPLPSAKTTCWRRPHARGGEPAHSILFLSSAVSSPRTWG